MKKLFLRVTSVALVLLLLFAVGGCKKEETVDPIDVKTTVAATTNKVNQADPKDDVVCMSMDDELFYVSYPDGKKEAYSLDAPLIVRMNYYSSATDSVGALKQDKDAKDFLKSFFAEPLELIPVSQDASGMALYVIFANEQQIGNGVFLSDDNLLFKDSKGNYYISQDDRFAMKEVLEAFGY